MVSHTQTQEEKEKHLSKTRAVTPAPKVINHSLRGREEVPPPSEHARRHGDLFPEKRVPQPRVVRHLLRGGAEGGKNGTKGRWVRAHRGGQHAFRGGDIGHTDQPRKVGSASVKDKRRTRSRGCMVQNKCLV